MELIPPEDKDSGRGWEQDLSTLGEQLGFALESSEHLGPPEEPSRTLTLVSLYHQTDREHWLEICQHLRLLEIAGYGLDHHTVPLTTNPEPEVLFVESMIAKARLNTAHLVLLALSVDLITALLQHHEICAILRADHHPPILPIGLRPVLWTCPFRAIKQVPHEAVTLWRNRDQAHVTIAQRVQDLLELTAAEDAKEEDNDEH